MNIGVNCFPLRPEIGGIKQYFLLLFNQLLANDKKNTYIFFYFKHNIETLRQLQSNQWEKHGILLTDQKQIYTYIDSVDLYFCPLSALTPRPLPCPTVVTLPDIQEVFYPGFFTFRNLVGRTYHFHGSAKMADQVITHSHYSKDTIAQHYHISRDKIQVAHHCVDNRFFQATEPARKPSTDLPENFVFYPANRWFHKNHDTLLRSLQLIKENSGEQIPVVFTGYDQENGYQINKKAVEYGIADQVYQPGYVSFEELLYLYHHAAILVFPSLFEGFGIPLIEAMATGCPVVAARATSLEEVGGDAVQFFQPQSVRDLADAILKVNSDASFREKLIRRGRMRATTFSAPLMAATHQTAFERAVSSYSYNRYLRRRYMTKYSHVLATALSVLKLKIKSSVH